MNKQLSLEKNISQNLKNKKLINKKFFEILLIFHNYVVGKLFFKIKLTCNIKREEKYKCQDKIMKL